MYTYVSYNMTIGNSNVKNLIFNKKTTLFSDILLRKSENVVYSIKY